MVTMKVAVGALAALALLGGCGNPFAGRDKAEQGVKEFHAAFNEAKFEAIVSAAGSELSEGANRQKLVTLLEAVRRKLGKVTGSSGQGFQVKTWNLKTLVTLVRDTTFEQGRGTETFTFVIRDGRALLAGYNINSTDLILK